MTEDLSKDILDREAHQRKLAVIVAIALVIALIIAIGALVQWGLAATPTP